jgi:hypothetical protein
VQVQIFFSLLASVALKYDEETLRDATNMDALLSIIITLPILLTLYLESPLHEYWTKAYQAHIGNHNAVLWWSQQEQQMIVKASLAILNESLEDLHQARLQESNVELDPSLESCNHTQSVQSGCVGPVESPNAVERLQRACSMNAPKQSEATRKHLKEGTACGSRQIELSPSDGPQQTAARMYSAVSNAAAQAAAASPEQRVQQRLQRARRRSNLPLPGRAEEGP